MPREESGLAPQHEEFGSDQPKLADVHRSSEESRIREQIMLMMSRFEEQANVLGKRLTSLEHGARQPRLTMEADGHANTKTRVRTEGAATAVQAMRGDSYTAQKVQDGPKTNSISFGVSPNLPLSLAGMTLWLRAAMHVMVESGDAAPQSCLSSLEMRTTAAAGGCVPTGKTSTATETIFNQSSLRFYSTEETDSEVICNKTSPLYASYDSSVVHESKLHAAPSYRRVVETKSRQNRTFDPSGSQGDLRARPFLGSWRALVRGEVMHAGSAGDELQHFF